MKKCLLHAALLAALTLTVLAGPRPNVIVLLVDDAGYGDLSAHGNPVIKTTNIDSIHDQAVRFLDFHVAPACTPTRGALLTGNESLRCGAREVGTDADNLRTDLPTMGEIFKNNGYATGLFGKWHLGDNYPLRPSDRGFEEVLSFPQASIGDKVGNYWTDNYFDDFLLHNNKWVQYKGYCEDVFMSEAIKWMTTQKDSGQPFFCYLPTNTVHSPYWVENGYRDPFRQGGPLANKSKDVQTFFGMLANLDYNVGRLLAFLKEANLADNTILIYAHDNGGTGGVNVYNAGMRGWKCTLWEGGHRAPLFVRWPKGNLGDPRDIKGLVHVPDLLPTLVDLCDLKIPDQTHFDGLSLADILHGKSQVPDRTLVVQWQRKDVIDKGDACVMWRNWRLVGGKELYDLSNDPAQARDVSADHPEITRQLTDYYDQWWANIEPATHLVTTAVVGNDAENPLTLNPSSWKAPYFVDQDRVREGRPAIQGSWRITVDRAGEYEVDLRRWPEDVNAPITAPTDPVPYKDTYVYGPQSEPGKALPITAARLKIGDVVKTIPVSAEDKTAKFTLTLPAGPTEVKALFLGQDGKPICAAYYVTFRRLSEKQLSQN